MRTYKLLRNNKETGPYSFEQLLQTQLKPLDLVWVEGRSAAWRYPCELAELSPYVPEPTDTFEQMIHPVEQPKVPQPKVSPPVPTVQTNISEKTISTPKKIHVTLPGNKSIHIAVPQTTYSEPFQQKQEVYQPQETYHPKEEFVQHPKQEFIPQYQSNTQPQSHYQYQPQPESFHKEIPLEEEVNTKYSRTLIDVEEDYTNWMYQKKTQKKSFFSERKNVVATGVLLLLVAASVFALNKLTFGKPAAETETAVAKPSSEEAVPTNKETSVTENSVNNNEANENEKKSVATVPQNERTEINHETKKIEEKKRLQKKANAVNNKEASVQNSPKQESRNVTVPQKEIAVERNQNQTQSQKDNAATEKRKKIRDVVKDFFARIKSKKQEAKKEDEPVTQTTQEPKHAEGRTSTKRGDGGISNDNSVSETSTTNIADEIELSGSNPSNGWMMGVSGLKVTLRNRSNVAIKSAAVEVLYYDENNRLLEKKTVYFANVPAKSRQTVAAPDQKWADHTEFRLGNVSAKEDRFAQN